MTVAKTSSLVEAAPEALLAHRLAAFVMRARALSSSPTSSLTIVQLRLQELLPRLAAALSAGGLQSPAPASTATLLTPVALSNLLQCFSVELSDARLRGDFINPWAVTGLRRREVRNAAALAWLLNPRGDHGLGVAPLRSLINLLANRDATWNPDLAHLEICQIRTEHRPLNSDRDRVDLVLQTPKLLIFLEVKIDAVQGNQQLSRYAESAAAQALLYSVDSPRVAFLTVRPRERPPGVLGLTWQELVRAIRASIQPKRQGGYSRRSVEQLLSHFSSFGE